MDKIEIVFESIRKMVAILVIEGLATIIIGVLIFIYPDLLGMLVGIMLIITGVLALYLGFKLNKYSKLKINL